MYSIKPLRISLPTDDRWDEISDFTIGPRGAPWQYLAHKIQRAAGLVAADVSPVELRRQGLEQAVTTGSTADYGRLVRVEEIDGDYVDNHWPDAVAGQIYRKTAVSSWNSNGAAPADPEGIWSGWSKQNNSGANDWSDVMNFSRVWQTTAAPHFTSPPCLPPSRSRRSCPRRARRRASASRSASFSPASTAASTSAPSPRRP